VVFVADDQVPFRRPELLLDLVVVRELVEPGDAQGSLLEGVSRSGGLEPVVRHDLEREPESLVQLILPLLGQVSRSLDEAALYIPANQELFDEEPRHSRLAAPGSSARVE
jgi:hypothetical protein